MDRAREKLLRESLLKGSALILTVVLTSLLAIVGVVFLMISRIDRMATSGLSEDKQLDLAVDAVVGEISKQLVWDIPGTIHPIYGPTEYHDYPGPNDLWLASIEPYGTDPNYYWRRISDIYGKLDANNLSVETVPDNEDQIAITEGLPADADGDGIADSIWVIVPGITSSRGDAVYAAVRVIDNCAMLNVNTAFLFDPNITLIDYIDGAALWNINLLGLAARPGKPHSLADITALLGARANYGVNTNINDLPLYEHNVGWQYGELAMPYTPFDISDELELRNRFLLNNGAIHARIEQLSWTDAFRTLKTVPFNATSSRPPRSGMSRKEWWFNHANRFGNLSDYDYRHLATIYSMDRVINPIGKKMVNINEDIVFDLVPAIKDAILDAYPQMASAPLALSKYACQLAANIKDFGDEDSDVTTVWDPNLGSNSTKYYGYERPCIYISEVAGVSTEIPAGSGTTYESYAVELYKPYPEDDVVKGWSLTFDPNGTADRVDIVWPAGQKFHVVTFKNSSGTDIGDFVDQSLSPQDVNITSTNFSALAGRKIYLRRSPNLTSEITVDSFYIPVAGASSGWLSPDGAVRSYQRDISPHKCIRRLQGSSCLDVTGRTLGNATNQYVNTGDPDVIQAHPYLDPAVYRDKYTRRVGFKNVGEISMVFDANAYNLKANDPNITERWLRFDPNEFIYSKIFNYLTVFDPANHGHGTNEMRIKGRVNINTAPPYVLRQLPWIDPCEPAGGPPFSIADLIVAYRENRTVPAGPDFSLKPHLGFGSIGELTWIEASDYPSCWGMDYYVDPGTASGPGDLNGFPDLSPGDGAADDGEERNLIFQRISNLVTVRSDVFSAYILVRIGVDGPQRRVLAILDRSEVNPNHPDPAQRNGKVKIHALHKVADPW